ncbi:EI24 domain-containing protein [Caldimonas tepidiphila]|uniref:EI24 domain-containing protein n=1 Tax=Caldimonas tepidiphila TaxID=2315841 RepID=UPI001F0C0BCE|nr:EI24 domain-containing protein [Caldimonas tepidiphila]
MMRPVLDALWRAAAYCLHPRVVLYSIAPVVLVAGLALLLGYFFWGDAVAAIRAQLEGWALVQTVTLLLESIGWEGFRSVMAPLILVALAVPVLVVLTLLLVSVLMTPGIVTLVTTRRFPRLERRHGESFLASVLHSLGVSLLALAALAVSLPFWLIPPLALLLPPLVWGWLTCRVMAFDALADHASREERLELMHRHRWPLLGLGVICGYLGAAPSLLWAFGAFTLILAPLLLAVSVWLYTLVFAFSSLWFAHYLLAALAALRAERDSAAAGELPLVERVEGVPPALAPAPAPMLPGDSA